VPRQLDSILVLNKYVERKVKHRQAHAPQYRVQYPRRHGGNIAAFIIAVFFSVDFPWTLLLGQVPLPQIGLLKEISFLGEVE
jgi:hypothetical protein